MKSNHRMPVLITSFLLVSLLLNGQVKSPVLSGKEKASLFNKQIEMRNSSAYKDLKWQYIGPTNISGRCTDVEAISPRGGSYTIWVGSATGGVWKSVNEGTTFEPVSDSIATASIGDIAIDPTNPDVVWVGSGEANIFRSSNAGCGVYKTTDGGKTWTRVLFEDAGSGAVDLTFDPSNPRILYASTWTMRRTPYSFSSGGAGCKLFKSTDNGETWKEISTNNSKK